MTSSLCFVLLGLGLRVAGSWVLGLPVLGLQGLGFGVYGVVEFGA